MERLSIDKTINQSRVMTVAPEVLDKIRHEERRHPFSEFGGYLLIKKNQVIDVVFDMDFKGSGSVDLGASVIIQLPPKKKTLVRGWFHKHPITGLSSTDEGTLADLTKFWGVCYTMVLQSNGKMLCIKSIYDKDKEIEETLKEEEEQRKQEEEAKKEEEEDSKDDEVPQMEEVKEENTVRKRSFFQKILDNRKGKLTEVNDNDERWTYDGNIKQGKHKKNNWRWTRPNLLKGIEFLVEEEFTFGVTTFTPRITNSIRKFRVWYPKLDIISRELEFSDLLNLETFHLVPSAGQAYEFSRQQIGNFIRAGTVKMLHCTGVMDMNDRLLYEGDKIDFTTSSDMEKRRGIITLENGEWAIITKGKFWKREVVELDDYVSVEYSGNATMEI